MKFERKPIEILPTCATCGRPLKDHDDKEINFCMKERRKSLTQKIIKNIKIDSKQCKD